LYAPPFLAEDGGAYCVPTDMQHSCKHQATYGSNTPIS